MRYQGWLALACLVSSTSLSAAESLVLGDWSGSLEMGYEGSRQNTNANNRPDDNFDSDLFRETLELRNQGSYIFDPRLGNANLGLTYELFQEQDRFVDSNGTQDGDLIGYDFDAAILPDKPLNLLLLASQIQNIVNRDFGTRTDIRSNAYRAHFSLREDSLLYDWGIPYFSATLAIDRQQTRETSRGQNQSFHRNEDRKGFDLTARKGFETADLDFRYTFEDVTDSVRSQGAFKNRSSVLNYSQDFGPQLNRRWDSRISYLQRSGANGNNSLIANEVIRLDHNEFFFSTYRYALNRFDTSNGRNQNQSVSSTLHHEFYRQLITNIIVQVQRDDIPSGTRDAYNTDANINYQRKLPLAGNLSLHLDGGAQLNDNDLDSQLVEVVDEAHAAPTSIGAGQGFFLNNLFVVTATIEVIDLRGGSRLPTEQGVDYEIFQEGDRSQIIPIATSVIIQPGDPLQVSYNHIVAPAIRFATGSWTLGGSIDYGWIAFSSSREQSNQRLLAGRDDGLLNDRLTDNIELTLRGKWTLLNGTSSFGYEREDSTRLKFDRWQFRQFLSLARSQDMRLSFSAAQAFTDFQLPLDRTRENYSARLTWNLHLFRTWQFGAFAGVRLLIDSEIPDEDIREAGLNLRQRFGKLSTSGSVSWNRFERGDVTTTDWRFQFHVTRRF